MYEMEIYQLGTPENNAKGAPYITPVYEDEAGVGLMVSFASPVYQEDTFLGIVGFDLTIVSLSNCMRANQYPGDNLFLINSESEIIASTSGAETQVRFSEKQIPELIKLGLLRQPMEREEKQTAIYIRTFDIN